MPTIEGYTSSGNYSPKSQSDLRTSLKRTHLTENELAALPLAQRLEQMTIMLFQTVNARDFDSPILSKYLSSTFRADDVDRIVPSADSLISYIDELRKASGGDIVYDHQIISTCVEVDERQDGATVWATLRATAMPFGHLVQDSVSRLTWVYKGRKTGWICTGHSGIRGGGVLGTTG